ncbi:hypothetical protein PA25_36260 [Pseudoalteromonas sp. A25]|uniref:hypothetical protein n=1 Tax=Pseudoalteromonas sp. A25 TaxID=116092 RepID=UPI0012607345|nr:hypothetical protein [Pseudoalteromonas sp. A25]BBN83641.1 hypothetical protein PA25_36260 [Pseudoalteromonas sp. A25]
MQQRKIIILFLFFTFCALLYFIISTAEQSSIGSQAVNDVRQVTDSHNPRQIQNQPPTLLEETNHKESVRCEAFEQAQQSAAWIKFNFIGLKAVNWYFQGVDKYQIAQTLAALYGYDKAMLWIKQVNGLSQYHEKHEELTQFIEGLDYSFSLGSERPSLQALEDYGVNTYVEGFDINKQLNFYPDTELKLWLGALTQALGDTDLQKSLSVIERLQKFSQNQVFFEHPLRDSNNVVLLSSFGKQQARQLLKAMFDLAPVYFDGLESGSASFFLNKPLWASMTTNLVGVLKTSLQTHLRLSQLLSSEWHN